MTSRADVVIVGGGPAGSAAAIWLARAGTKVVLVERSAEPHHKVCGEFVSGEAGRCLRELGLDAPLLDSTPISILRVLRGDRLAESRLPFPASSLSRRILDQRLLDIACAQGVKLRRGVTARSAEVAPGGVSVQLSDKTAIHAAALFLATGKHDLRGLGREAGIQNQMIGLKMHLDLTAVAAGSLTGAVELLLFDGGYAGLQLVGPRRGNLCLLVSKDRYETLGRSWPGLADGLIADAPLWRERLHAARPCWKQPLSIYGLPYGYVARAEGGPVFRLGDQLAVIPSFAGDGMAMALTSARRAAKAFLARGADAAGYHRRMARSFGPRVRASAWASRLLERPLLQALTVGAAAEAPALLAWAAEATRVGRDSPAN